MKQVLHILTRSDDALAGQVIKKQRVQAECEIEIVDLSTGSPDYAALLGKIFAADSVAVW